MPDPVLPIGRRCWVNRGKLCSWTIIFAVLSLGAHSKEIKVSKSYLLMPISNDAARNQTISLSVDGKQVRQVKAGLAEKKEDVDWWAFFDISDYKGKTLVVNIQPMKTEVFALITQSDQVPGEDKWGTEAKRPQFHFSQKVGWINDPNGMVYYKGEWHLYFQHNPIALPWGNMTWGHAVSKDLVSWKQLPNVFHHKSGDRMFSGGAVVDWKNTGGWKTGENDVIVAAWTSTGCGECIAYSNDKGRTFTEYEGNPVIKHKGRDPKPLWYAYGEKDTPLDDTAKTLGGHWIIAIYAEPEKQDRGVAFYTSTDLKKWTFQSHFSGFYECAELFTLPVDGKIAIRILIDRPMMEIFANHGEQIATLPYENDLNIESVKAFCEGGDAKLLSLEVHELNATWSK